MFWKTEQPGPTDPPRRGGGRWSIARRLALLHILAVLVSYILFGALFYSKRMTQLGEESLADLNAERASIVDMMGQPDARVLVGYEIRTEQFEPENLRPFIRILDGRGRVLQESPWLEKAIPRGTFPPIGATRRATVTCSGAFGFRTSSSAARAGCCSWASTPTTRRNWGTSSD